MNFWCSQNAIQLEEKEKRRRETRKGKDAEPYLQAFYEERELDVESSKANNSEWEKVKCWSAFNARTSVYVLLLDFIAVYVYRVFFFFSLNFR